MINVEAKKTKVSKRRVAQVLRLGANNIEKFGWAQGRFGNQATGFCAVGSFFANYGGKGFTTYEEESVAINALGAVLHQDIVFFNDQLGRKAEDIVSLFRKTARAVEHGLKFQQEVLKFQQEV